MQAFLATYGRSALTAGYFLAYMFYSLAAHFVLHVEKENNARRRLVFLLCCALALWAFSFAMASHAEQVGAFLFWRRVGAVGWALMWAFTVHFVVVISGHEAGIRKLKWPYVAIYLPAALNILFFSILPSAEQNFTLVATHFGWVTLWRNSLLMNLYALYMVLSAGACFLLLRQWAAKENSPAVKKQARLLQIALAFAVITGSSSEYIVNTFLHSKVPQLSAILIMVPIIAVIYSIRRYNILDTSLSVPFTPLGRVLNEKIRRTIFDTVGYVFIGGGIAHMFINYFWDGKPFVYSMLTGGLFVITGEFISYLDVLFKKVTTQERIFYSFTGLAGAFLAVLYRDQGGITVWGIPLLFLIVLIPFPSSTYLSFMSLFTLLAPFYLAYVRPTVDTVVGIFDYLLRFIIMLVAVFLARYVSTIYRERLEENAEQIRFQRAVSRLSESLSQATAAEYEMTIENTLRNVAAFMKANRVSVWLLDQNREIHSYSLVTDPVASSVRFEASPLLRASQYPYWTKLLHGAKREEIHILDTSDIPLFAKEEAAYCQRFGVRNFLLIPLLTSTDVAMGTLNIENTGDASIADDQRARDYRDIAANTLASYLARVRSEEQIRYLAYHDPLTGLLNREVFRNQVNEAIREKSVNNGHFALVFIDLDTFKNINDTAGHESGDRLLVRVARGLTGALSKADVVARFGGDEFLILLKSAEESGQLIATAEKLLQLFSQPITIAKQEIFVTASMGIAIYPQHGTTASALMQNADTAMYAAKAAGKNRYQVYEEGMSTSTLMDRRALFNDLHRVTERGELYLLYQPIVELRSHRIIAVESLLRWQHPRLGLIMPGDFIRVAEETGLIRAIGRWVTWQVCLTGKRLLEDGHDITISMNVSSESLREANMAKSLQETIKNTGMNPRYLDLEITESAAVKDPEMTAKILAELRDYGVSITLDDFGVEYSSLGRLRAFPLDHIKIDQSFVQGISLNTKDENIIRNILVLAETMGIKVVAEGVETDVQARFLNELNCHYAQGFYFSQPLHYEELVEQLQQQKSASDESDAVQMYFSDEKPPLPT